MDRSLARIDSAPTKQLRQWAREFQPVLKAVVARYGVTATLEQLEAMLTEDRERAHVGRNTYWCISKYHLSQAFQRYDNALPAFTSLSLHARVGIDIRTFRSSTETMEVFQVESSLFEDMAVLWNETVRASSKAERPDCSNQQVKYASAYARATAKAAFNLLEGYLNGMAGDILLLTKVRPDETTKLEEWDANKDRPRFLSLRDKLLQYPKIAIGSAHPPLQESWPVLTRVLQLEMHLRHALIHPRPQVHVSDPAEFREAAFFELSNAVVGQLCDDVIDLIARISKIVGPEYGDVSLWLAARLPDGLFSESVFS